MTWALVCAVPLLASMAAAQEFEVAAVKPHASGAACAESNTYPGGRLVLSCFSLYDLIREAYDLRPNELAGGPAWSMNDGWDVTAKAANIAGELTPDRYRAMLGRLIAQRFGLKLRNEKRMVKGFDLERVAKTKARGLHPNTGAPYQFDFKPGLTIEAQDVSMRELAAWLKMPMGAGERVEDKTGLAGGYDFRLKWSLTGIERRTDAAAVNDAPTIYTALKEQLGLRLRPARVMTDVYVIEKAEKPEE